MGAWGYGLFQSDQELDTMDEISSEASKLANDPDFTFWYPENKDEVVTKLNAGLFHQLLEKFQNIENIDLLQGHWIGFSESLRSIGFDQLLSLELLEVGTSGEEIVRLLDEDSDINFVWGWDPKRSELCDYVRQKTSTNPYIEF